MAFCNTLVLTLAQVLVGTVPRCPAAYTLTIKNNGRQALLAGARLRLESDDPTVTALRTCTFSSDSANVSDVLVSNGVLTFTLDVGIEACSSVELEFGVETVNVSARASRNVVLRAFLDAYAFVETAARRCNAPVPDPYHAKPVIVSNALCALVNVTDDCAPPLPNIIYVKATGVDGSGFGCSWETALIGPTGLLTAATNAKPRDQIWVAAGTYPLQSTLDLTEGVSLYGGFVGTESLLCERCIGRATLDEASGTVVSSAGMFDTVEVAGNDVVIDGVSFESGSASPNVIKNDAQRLVLRHVTITNTSNTDVGVRNDIEFSSFSACDILINGFEAGIFVDNDKTSFTLDGARLESNDTAIVITQADSEEILYDCVIVGNNTGIIAQNGGGNIIVNNCTIANNSGFGINITNNFTSSVCILNSIVTLNGAPPTYNGDISITGPTNYMAIVDSLVNTITVLGAATVQEIRRKTGSAGFVNATTGNYELTATSQALNCGNNAYVKTLTDVAGLPRIVGAKVDLGAYERQAPLGCE